MDWDLLSLPNVPVDSPFLQAFLRLAAQHGYSRRCNSEQQVILCELPDTWAAFYASLSHHTKNYLNNLLNRLHREGHQEHLVVVQDPDQLNMFFSSLFTWHRQRAAPSHHNPHQDYFPTLAHQEFMRTVTPALLEQGQCWPRLLVVNDTPVAAQLYFWSFPAFVDTEILGTMPGEGVHDAKEPSPVSGGVSR
jgi:hypothetical protein